MATIHEVTPNASNAAKEIPLEIEGNENEEAIAQQLLEHHAAMYEQELWMMVGRAAANQQIHFP